LVNFAIFLFLVRDGSPSHRPDGSFALTSHGRLVREVSEEEFHRYQAYVARGFSGHWMLFYGVSLVVLASDPRRADGRTKSEG
jgi:hypothetical protein